MSTATLTAKGQIVIPAEIRARYELTPGTQVEFVDEGGVIRLLVRRRVAASDPASGFGMVRVKPSLPGRGARRLSQFDPASLTMASLANSPRKTSK
jgi:antitoxin PrlF